MKWREVVLTAPDGNRVVYATIRGWPNEARDQLMVLRARDWARRMYGQQSSVIESVRVEERQKP